MTVSGTTDFTQTRNELIYDAFQIIGVYGVGRTISSEDMNFACNTLNKMIKSWGTKGLHLWTKEENTLFIQSNTEAYQLGGTANACAASDAIITSTTAAITLGSTTIPVATTAGMAINDYIGVVQIDGSIFYSQISSIPSGISLIINSPLAENVVYNSNVYTYTTPIVKPLRITSCRRAQGIDLGISTSLTEILMAPIAYEDYFNLPSKSISGVPNQFHYSPQVNNGMLYLWQRPNSGIYYINFTSERIIDDLDNAGDNFDFPNEWLEPLTWQLALRLCPAFGKDKRMMSVIAPMAESMLTALLDWDTEITSILIQPDDEH